MIRPGSRERSIRTAMLVAGDFAVASLALAATVSLRHNVPIPFTRSLLPETIVPLEWPEVLLFGTTFVSAVALAGFYRSRITTRARPIVAVALLIQVALVAIGASILEWPLPRTILLGVPLLEAILFPLWRALQRRLWPVRPRETILVGEPEEIAAALSVLETARDHRIRVTAYVSSRAGSFEDPAVRATLRDAEEVICISADAAPRSRLELLRIRGPRGYLLLASSADALLISSVLGWMGDEPLIEVRIGCAFGVQAALKRAIDVVLASILFVLALPLWIAVSVALLVSDGRPILLRQQRLGRGSVPFAMWKFRTMRHGHHPDDERVTRLGRFLRRYRIDELPQLLNVIAGDMSLVGPRPERPEIAQRILEDVPDFDLRCLVRPGIAGLAQILSEYDSRPSVKLRYDITYMCSWSLWLDVRLLFSSVAAALSGSGV